MKISIDSVLVQDAEPAAAALDGDIVLMSLREGCYFSFNAVASEIWRMLAKPRRVEELFDALVRSHAVDAQTLTRDVTPFLQNLVDRHLLRVVEPAGAP